jgi:hypothetical protein
MDVTEMVNLSDKTSVPFIHGACTPEFKDALKFQRHFGWQFLQKLGGGSVHKVI